MKTVYALLTLLALFVPAPSRAQSVRTIHVYVALADNAHQGLVPVPAKIGNGDDPANNLYWGCDEGLKAYFKKSNEWKLVSVHDPRTSVVLERCVFKHVNTNAYLIADAYRGREIKTAIEDFLAAASGTRAEGIKVNLNNQSITLPTAGRADLVAYIGHNGLMDFAIESATVRAPAHKPAIVLCCMSRQYFGDRLETQGAAPLLLTTQLMYPGSFILKSALDGWLAGESPVKIKSRAAQAYAKNQQISHKSALGVFAP